MRPRFRLAEKRGPTRRTESPMHLVAAGRDAWIVAGIAMWRASFEGGVGIVDPHPIEEQRQYFIDEVLPRNDVRFAILANELVGFIAASSEAVAQLYVHVAFQRRGIGAQLLTWAKEHSCGSLWLYTFARNLGACAFYERHGFTAIERGFEPMPSEFRAALRTRWLTLVQLLCTLAIVAGCDAHYQVNAPEKKADIREGYRLERVKADPDNPGDVLVILTLSGGGTRAASLAYGTMEALRDVTLKIGGRSRTLLDEVDIINAVSGGSIVAAYYAVHRDGLFRDFERKFLKRDIESELRTALLANLPRLAHGRMVRLATDRARGLTRYRRRNLQRDLSPDRPQPRGEVRRVPPNRRRIGRGRRNGFPRQAAWQGGLLFAAGRPEQR